MGEDQKFGWNMMLEMRIRCAKREILGRTLDLSSGDLSGLVP